MLALQGGLDGQTRQAVEQVLLQLPVLPNENKRAWTLRHTIDAVLAGEPVRVPQEYSPPPTLPSPAAAATKVEPGPATVSMASGAAGEAESGHAKSASKESAAGADDTSVASRVALLEGQTASAAASSLAPSADRSAAPSVEAGDGSGAVIAEVQDDGWEEELACSICLEFLWEPVTLGCAHSFCRPCLLRTTQLSPDGGRCPNCRSKIDINPDQAPVDTALQARVKAVVSCCGTHSVTSGKRDPRVIRLP